MKKLKYFILGICVFILLGTTFCYSDIVRDIQDNHMVIYYIADASGDHVSGQTVTLSTMRVSDEYWFDFNDNAFKASGWTSKTTNLSEDSTNGFYYYSFDPPAGETGADQYLFVVDNSNATYGDHQGEIVSYQNIGVGTSTLVASDNIGINWADISNPTTTVGLTNTTVLKLVELDEDNTTIDLDGSTVGTVTTLTTKTGFSLSAAGIDSIFDEDITGHTTADTAGKRIGGLSEVGLMFGDGYTVDSASSTTIIDAAFSAYGNDFFIGYYIIMTSGSADDEVKEVIDFVTTSGTFTVYPDWVVTPSAADTYELWRGKPTIILPGR